MSLKVGDKVRIKSKEWYDQQNFINVAQCVLDCCGKVATITEVKANGYSLDIGSKNIRWVESCIEPISDGLVSTDNDHKLYIPSAAELKKSVTVNVPNDMEVSTEESDGRITINVQHKEEKVEKQKLKNGDIIYVQERAGGYIAIFQNMKSTGGFFLLPLEYPKPYQINDALDVENANVAELKHWELAPYNAMFLQKENVDFAFTMNKLKDKSSFLGKIRELYKNGLSKEAILKSLTENPAKIVKSETTLGNLRKGSYANFLLFTEDLFSKDAVLQENWVAGKNFVVNKLLDQDIRGVYQLTINNQNYDLKIAGLS